jgi:iron(III) transport system permease protein
VTQGEVEIPVILCLTASVGFGGGLLVTVCIEAAQRSGDRQIDQREIREASLEDTARSLGENPRGSFWRVVLPQLRTAMLGGALLIALNTLVEFGAFALMRFRTFTTEIYAAYQAGLGDVEIAALALVLLGLCLLCLAAEAILRRRRSYVRVGRGVRRPPAIYRLGAWRWPAFAAMSALYGLAVGVPLGMILFWLTRHGSAAITPDEVSPSCGARRYGYHGWARGRGRFVQNYPSAAAWYPIEPL